MEGRNGYLPPPKHAAGRLWNVLAHRLKPARWVDNWWWERARVPQEVGSFASEGAVYALGWLIALAVPGLIPAVALITVARVASHFDELHMLYESLRHRDKSLFDRPQMWRRDGDGGKSFDATLGAELPPAPENATPGRGVLRTARRWLSDIWTEQRRVPGFALGMTLVGLGFLAGSVLGAPVALVAGIEYFTLAQQQFPSPRNVILAIKERDWDYILRPQVAHAVRRGRLRDEHEAEPAVGDAVGADGMDHSSPVQAPRTAQAPRAPNRYQIELRRLNGVPYAARHRRRHRGSSHPLQMRRPIAHLSESPAAGVTKPAARPSGAVLQ